MATTKRAAKAAPAPPAPAAAERYAIVRGFGYEGRYLTRQHSGEVAALPKEVRDRHIRAGNIVKLANNATR